MDKYRIKTSKEEIQKLRNTTQHGVYNGLHDDYKLNFTYKPGFFTIVAGPPASGKTEFVLSEFMTFIERDNAKVLVFSPESGTKAELIGMCLTNKFGGSIYKEDNNVITEEQVDNFLNKYNDNLFVIDDDGTRQYYTLEDIFKIQEDLEKEVGKIEYVIIDNLNDIKEPPAINGRTDVGLEEMYVTLRRHCRKTQSHYIAVTHSSNQGRPAELKQGGEVIRYYPPITVREIRGGEANQRKGYNILALWRPPAGVKCPQTDREYSTNETHIRVLKAKPKGAAIPHSTAVLFYDVKYSKLRYLNPALMESEAQTQRNRIRSGELAGQNTIKTDPQKKQEIKKPTEVIF